MFAPFGLITLDHASPGPRSQSLIYSASWRGIYEAKELTSRVWGRKGIVAVQAHIAFGTLKRLLPWSGVGKW